MPLSAFLSTPVLPLQRVRAFSLNNRCTSPRPSLSRRATPTASTSISPKAEALIREQLKNPLFDVEKAPIELSVVLGRLQDENSFVSLGDLGERTARAQAAEAIREHVEAAIAAARELVQREYPGITTEGGALHPEHRARACWRDLSEFSRVVAYGVASGRQVFSERGVEIMKQVYEELEVPMDAMVTAVSTVAREIRGKVKDVDVEIEIAGGFDSLLEILATF